MAAPIIIGPLNSLVLTPAANRVAYQVSTLATLKTSQGLCVGLTCVGAGAIALWDASVVNTTTFTITSNNSTSTGTVTAGFLSATNQFYTNSSLTVGQTLQLGVPCAAGVVASAAGTFNIGFA
jgi:hypothetical protein